MSDLRDGRATTLSQPPQGNHYNKLTQAGYNHHLLFIGYGNVRSFKTYDPSLVSRAILAADRVDNACSTTMTTFTTIAVMKRCCPKITKQKGNAGEQQTSEITGGVGSSAILNPTNSQSERWKCRASQSEHRDMVTCVDGTGHVYNHVTLATS